MNSTNNSAAGSAFYTVPEAARILRVTPATLYRAIREDAFPAVTNPHPLRHPGGRAGEVDDRGG